MRALFSGMFADVVNPMSVLFSPPVLIVAVLILAAGFLGYFIGKAHGEKKGKGREEQTEEEMKE